jgi:HK97 family phage prohead protease
MNVMQKSESAYNIKHIDLSIKDMDISKREVAIYLSKFDVIDSDNDMITRGAFKKSLQERGVGSTSNRKIAFLRYHDWQHQIGKFTTLEEDDNGLFAVGQLGTSTKGEDALRDYEDGIILEHSIGFQYITDKMKFIEDDNAPSGGYFVINEVKLWEGSAVTFGANEYTNVVEVAKSTEGKKDALHKIANQIGLVSKALANGNGTDERLYELEMKLKYLNARLVDISNIDPLDIKQSTVEDQQPVFNWSEVSKLINY